jgi:hypothetical protein
LGAAVIGSRPIDPRDLRRKLHVEALEHDADYGEMDEGGDGFGAALEIACQAPDPWRSGCR